MIHFAYPNVKVTQSKFIGCGRYAAGPVEQPFSADYLAAEPKIVKLTAVQTAASILAKESFDTGLIIYEKKDEPNEVYRGDSQDLAYFLALVSRSNRVELTPDSGDIWCTGVIDIIDGKKAFLGSVKPQEFEIKLNAFLSEENRDLLFILPAANLLPSYESLFRNKNIRILSIDQCKKSDVKKLSQQKTILKVHGNELERLIAVLFVGKTGSNKPPSYWIVALLLILALCVGAIVTIRTHRRISPSAAGLMEQWIEPVTGMHFVWIPGGSFEMGCDGRVDDYCVPCELPIHWVSLEGFWLGKYEVTQGEWKRIIGSNPSIYWECGNDCPVENISWHDAQLFLRKLSHQSGTSFRLPTEAEWEYACRSGGKAEKYAGGFAHENAWYGDHEGKPNPVGRKPPNGLGLFDMSGNVWEWCEDNYQCLAYGKHDQNQPVNRDGKGRVQRGGAFCSDSAAIRCAYRTGVPAVHKSKDTGLRIVAVSVGDADINKEKVYTSK